MGKFFGGMSTFVLFLSLNVYSDQSQFECKGSGFSLPINNAQVLHWKKTTPNQFLERAHVLGEITQVFPRKSGHYHFEIQIGNYPDSTIEVIYNDQFGSIPTPTLGMVVEACGDYITSYRRSGQYPASPDGAIIHWVHMNPKEKGHLPGFLAINGSLYGQSLPTNVRH